MAYSKDIVQQVWEKARGMPDWDPSEWRQDECGAWIHRAQYDKPTAEFGWKIENVTPGHPDEVENLRPFHHGNSFDRAQGQPQCQVVADREAVMPTASLGEPRNILPG